MKKFKFNKVSIIVLAVMLTLGVFGIVKALSSPATSPDLGDADSFSILAKTLVSDVPTSSIAGDVGLDAAGSNITGLTSLEVAGTIYDTNGTGPDAGLGYNPTLMTSARLANKTAFDNLSAAPNETCGDGTAGGNGSDGSSGTAYGINWTTLTPGTIDLSGKTLVPGIYCAGAFTLSGTLTLDDSAGASGVWIFRSAATLATTGSIAKVVFSSGNTSSACNVWWKLVSSATIGTYTEFIGNILASTSISMGTGAKLIGRAFAYTGAVTLASNTISGCAAPVATTTLTLDKIVVGGSSAESAWTLTATGPTTLTGPGAAGSTDVFSSVPAGTYVLSESVGPSNYDASIWSCTVDGGAVSGDPLILASGHAAICTITNTYHEPSSGSSITYGCKDETATNYNYFSTSKPSLCEYASVIAVVTPTVIVPKLPKTGFPPQTWYESLLNSFLSLFR